MNKIEKYDRVDSSLLITSTSGAANFCIPVIQEVKNLFPNLIKYIQNIYSRPLI
jgi:hypothetical protein